MSEERTPRGLTLDMEPVVRDLRNGIDAAVALAMSPLYGQREPNGLFYIAEALETNVGQLRELWRELAAATDGQPVYAPLKAVEE